MTTTNTLPTDSAVRKDIPLASGCYDYFPAALAEVARLSKAANEKHNPGEEMHHARGKSMDHADCIARHQVDRGTFDTDGFLHDVKVAWRALAQLQEALEARGAPLARAARLPDAAQSLMPAAFADFVNAAIPITRGRDGVLRRHVGGASGAPCTDQLENSYE